MIEAEIPKNTVFSSSQTHSYILIISTVNKYGYAPANNEQTEDIIRRFMDIYDSLGTVLNCESK